MSMEAGPATWVASTSPEPAMRSRRWREAPMRVSPEPAMSTEAGPATLAMVQSPQPALSSSRLALRPTLPKTAPEASTLAFIGVRTTTWGRSFHSTLPTPRTVTLTPASPSERLPSVSTSACRGSS